MNVAPVLSESIFIGFDTIMPSSSSINHTASTSCVVTTTARYTALVLDLASVLYFRDIQDTSVPTMNTRNPVQLFLSTVSPPHSESQYAIMLKLSDFRINTSCFWVPAKYCNTRLTAAQCFGFGDAMTCGNIFSATWTSGMVIMMY